MKPVTPPPVSLRRSIPAAALVVCLFAPGTQGCTREIKKPHLADLQVEAPRPTLPKSTCRVRAEIERSLPSVDLDETTWDDAGPRRDIEFPGKIGYVQTYRFHFLQISYLLTEKPIETRIVIPFGRLLTEKLRRALDQTFPASTVCQREACEDQRPGSRAFDLRVALELESFRVWEEPRNHLNYRARILSWTNADGRRRDEHAVTHELLRQKLGNVWNRSPNFVNEMQQSTNAFADEIVSGFIADAARRCADPDG